KLALKLHPDRNVGSQDVDKRFKEVNEAYEVLRNPVEKSQYARFGGLTGYSRDPFEDLFVDTPFGLETGKESKAETSRCCMPPAFAASA
ncbi:MAG: DnaJ domain-containing protein, partial [Candidatus Hodgkinia cicadicola]